MDEKNAYEVACIYPHVQITFRGEERTVFIEQFIEERHTNYYCVEWHFLDPELNLLELTNQEEDDIQDELWEYRYD